MCNTKEAFTINGACVDFRTNLILTIVGQMKHPLFISRTVLVQNNNIEAAAVIINRILGREGIFEEIRRKERYEKPWQTRRRINYERCKAIYNEDMERRINFLMRKNRTEPYPGCY